MARDNPPEPEVEGWLKSLGVQLLAEWDVLVFLYRHHASLVSGEHIARLLGHPTGAVVAALERLGTFGLVERSRVARGVRLYQFAAPAAPRPGDAFERLLALEDSRAGRLLLSGKLRRDNPPTETRNQPQEQGKGHPKWLKAI